MWDPVLHFLPSSVLLFLPTLDASCCLFFSSFSLVSQYDLSLIILFDRSSENFQDWVPSNNVAAPHVPSAFQDWRQMCNGSAFMPFGQTAANSNVFYQNLTFNSWTSNNMPRNPVYTSFHPAAIEDHHAPLFHSNNHDIDPGTYICTHAWSLTNIK